MASPPVKLIPLAVRWLTTAGGRSAVISTVCRVWASRPPRPGSICLGDLNPAEELLVEDLPCLQ